MDLLPMLFDLHAFLEDLLADMDEGEDVKLEALYDALDEFLASLDDDEFESADDDEATEYGPPEDYCPECGHHLV
jgi:hypothetical protein